MSRATRPVLALTATLSLAAACAESSVASSGVPGSKSVDQVTDSEARKSCLWMSDFLFRSFTVERGCTVDGVEETSSTAECRAYVEVCKEESDREAGADEDTTCDEAAALERPSPGCSQVTVSDFEACIRALERQVDDLYTGASCEKRELPPEPAFPAICQRIATACPELPVPGADSEDEVSGSR
jgi:hypothetical protein